MHLSSQKKNRLSAKNISSTVPCDLALKILNRIPPEHRQSFTSQQVVALQTALAEKRQKSSAFTLSLGPYYLSLVAGRNQRLNPRQLNQSLLAPMLCVMVSMLGVGGVMGLLKLRYGYQSHVHSALHNQQQQTVHPTVLPFRKDAMNCEKNGAVWIDNECVDHGHDLTF